LKLLQLPSIRSCRCFHLVAALARPGSDRSLLLLLAQVLILLRTLLLPGKQPTDTLKDKSRMQVRSHAHAQERAGSMDLAAACVASSPLSGLETGWPCAG
jgi:hypothetical protein